MKNRAQEYTELPNKILSALSMLDEKGTNESVTKAMSIVYEAFQRHTSKKEFSARDLLKSVVLSKWN